MNTRGKIITAYLVVSAIVAGVSWCMRRHQTASYEARQPFAANHRIVAADLVIPDAVKDSARENALPDPKSLTDKYLVRDVRIHEPVVESDLVDEPRIALVKGMALVAVKVSEDLPVNVIDVGSRVDIISGDKHIAFDIPVTALRCRSACAALVIVPEKTALAIASDKNAIAVPIARAEAQKTKGATVDSKTWEDALRVDVSATPDGLWTKAIEFVPPNTTLKLEASGAWKYTNQHERKCGPDGDAGAATDTSFLKQTAPVGAVIAKVGGSSAGKDDGTVFVIGAFAIITLQKEQSGPLYLTMNVNPAQRPTTTDKMAVAISEMKR